MASGDVCTFCGRALAGSFGMDLSGRVYCRHPDCPADLARETMLERLIAAEARVAALEQQRAFLSFDQLEGALTPDEFMAALLAERERAEALHPGTLDIPDAPPGVLVASKAWENLARIACEDAQSRGCLTHWHTFGEETAEVMTAAAEGDVEELRKELLQVAGLCFKWLNALERRARAGSVG